MSQNIAICLIALDVIVLVGIIIWLARLNARVNSMQASISYSKVRLEDITNFLDRGAPRVGSGEAQSPNRQPAGQYPQAHRQERQAQGPMPGRQQAREPRQAPQQATRQVPQAYANPRQGQQDRQAARQYAKQAQDRRMRQAQPQPQSLPRQQAQPQTQRQSRQDQGRPRYPAYQHPESVQMNARQGRPAAAAQGRQRPRRSSFSRASGTPSIPFGEDRRPQIRAAQIAAQNTYDPTVNSIELAEPDREHHSQELGTRQPGSAQGKHRPKHAAI